MIDMPWLEPYPAGVRWDIDITRPQLTARKD